MDQDSGRGADEQWSESGYIVKVKLSKLAENLILGVKEGEVSSIYINDSITEVGRTMEGEEWRERWRFSCRYI